MYYKVLIDNNVGFLPSPINGGIVCIQSGVAYAASGSCLMLMNASITK
jgi:hypothetical protein